MTTDPPGGARGETSAFFVPSTLALVASAEGIPSAGADPRRRVGLRLLRGDPGGARRPDEASWALLASARRRIDELERAESAGDARGASAARARAESEWAGVEASAAVLAFLEEVANDPTASDARAVLLSVGTELLPALRWKWSLLRPHAREPRTQGLDPSSLAGLPADLCLALLEPAILSDPDWGPSRAWATAALRAAEASALDGRARHDIVGRFAAGARRVGDELARTRAGPEAAQDAIAVLRDVEDAMGATPAGLRAEAALHEDVALGLPLRHDTAALRVRHLRGALECVPDAAGPRREIEHLEFWCHDRHEALARFAVEESMVDLRLLAAVDEALHGAGARTDAGRAGRRRFAAIEREAWRRLGLDAGGGEIEEARRFLETSLDHRLYAPRRVDIGAIRRTVLERWPVARDAPWDRVEDLLGRPRSDWREALAEGLPPSLPRTADDLLRPARAAVARGEIGIPGAS